MYVYVQSEPSLWTVGFYDPTGKWQPESDHPTRAAAARRVVVLNGGDPAHLDAPVDRPSSGGTLNYPAGWPKCPGCGRPALDGHITCGDVRCNESAWRR